MRREEPVLPEQFRAYEGYIDNIMVGVEDAVVTHREHPQHGTQLIVELTCAADLVDLGRSLECSPDNPLEFDIEAGPHGTFILVLDTDFLEENA